MANTGTIPVICGPTASGKTGIAVDFAETYAIEVISADSRQIVKDMDVGTAKPTPDECSKVRFHLVDIVEPGVRYSAFKFVEDTTTAIKEIETRGNIPVVVGGTGLYLHALTEGVVEIDDTDLSIRVKLEDEMEKLGPEVMYDRLTKIDPIEATKLHANNRVRVIRALEIFELTGKCKTEIAATGVYRKSDREFKYFCLLPERAHLYEIINHRVDLMINEGLVDEVRELIGKYGIERVRKARVIGYSELVDYLDGVLTQEEAINLIKQNTRRYAKRQFTWFRRQTACNTYVDRSSLKKDLEVLLKEFWNNS